MAITNTCPMSEQCLYAKRQLSGISGFITCTLSSGIHCWALAQMCRPRLVPGIGYRHQARVRQQRRDARAHGAQRRQLVRRAAEHQRERRHRAQLLVVAPGWLKQLAHLRARRAQDARSREAPLGQA